MICTIKRVAKNTGMLFFADVMSKILSFLFVMYAARYLGATGFGILSFALAFTGMFGIFADLGLQKLVIRDVARDKSLANKYFSNIIGMKIVLVLITFGLIALVINLIGYPKETIIVVYFIALSVIFNTFTQTFYAIFQAYERMEFYSIGQVLNGILLLLGALIEIYKGSDVVAFAAVYFVVSIILLVYSVSISFWKFIIPTLEIDWIFWKSTIKETLPFALSSIFVIIYYYIGSIILYTLQGNGAVGWFNAAYRFVYVLSFIPSAYFSSIYPIMSNFLKHLLIL